MKTSKVLHYTIALVCILMVSVNLPNRAQDMETEKNASLETITLGAGCFWCVEAVFQRVQGVVAVKSGYTGGKLKNPTYKEICTGTTGHAEACQLTFNPEEVALSKILEIFWKTHDPTTLNRQGNDVGTQYRSAIFYHSDEQRELAEHLKRKLDIDNIWDKPIVTEIVPFDVFYPAEDYHDKYYENNPSQPYCSFVISPKVKKFEKLFEEYVK